MLYFEIFWLRFLAIESPLLFRIKLLYNNKEKITTLQFLNINDVFHPKQHLIPKLFWLSNEIEMNF